MRDEKIIQGDNWKKILTASDSIAESFVIQPSAVVTKADHQLYFSGDHKKSILLSEQSTVIFFVVIKKCGIYSHQSNFQIIGNLIKISFRRLWYTLFEDALQSSETKLWSGFAREASYRTQRQFFVCFRDLI